MILGGSGLVGTAIARQLLDQRPASIVISGLTRVEAEDGVRALRGHPQAHGVGIVPAWGDIFLPAAFKDRGRTDVLDDPEARGRLLDDLYDPVSDVVVEASALGSLLNEHRPDLIVDCINTATVIAYQDAYRGVMGLRAKARAGEATADDVERHLARMYLPQLIRHVQIALEAMRRVGTRMYLKIGTAGTGGMGLNVPFTHSEERPSRVLLAKASLAGAHSLLLYLMARTPGGPAVKEIKPTAAIAWKSIGFGEIRRGGRPIRRVDAVKPLPVADALARDGEDGGGAWRETGDTLTGVYLDAGENGMFSLSEFETLTSLGLMEFITPEEIAQDAVREITGHPTGHDIVGALDAATSGPTYRAGVLRQSAIVRMEALEADHSVRSVAYEMLGPPRLTKLLFEAAILGRIAGGKLRTAAGRSREQLSVDAAALIHRDEDLRTRILSSGLPILLPDGHRMLRGELVKVRPETRDPEEHHKLADSGWVDLRSSNWERWRVRASTLLQEVESRPGAEAGSAWDTEIWHEALRIRPGVMAAWVLRHEDHGERIKR